ncbi:MAG: hypothetical protein LJE70_01850 [Chromatiaceae bacterium]|jgi:intracellular sulfur oxidation DsrE/DsrF family protein|nr:hypothetical protein [Chromatiaceae bacterium]
MKGELRFTDEDLHRYIDREMDAKAKSELDDLLGQNPSLAARVREYRFVDQAVREAFDGVESPVRHRPGASVRVERRVIAAVLFLPVFFLAGWFGNSLLSGSDVQEALAGGITLPVAGREHLNALFHIDLNDQSVMEGVLDRAEAVLTSYADRDVQVEVVANAAGLDLLRADKSPFAPRIRNMMDKYDNLSFVACANTIKRLREQGVDVLLIDRTHARETAIDHVVERLRDGWTYIKI